MRIYDPPLDEGIAPFVAILVENGVETYESCEGGPGHSYAAPAIRFHGTRAEGWRALSVALAANLPVAFLRRFWSIEEGEPTGPSWEMAFYRTAQSD